MIKRKLDVITLSIIISLFLLINEYFSLILWFLFYFIGKEISVSLFKGVRSKNYYQDFFYIFSLIGLLICIDNYFNFGVLYGFAGDDKTYLDGAKYLVGQKHTFHGNPSIFSYLLSIIAYPVSFFKEVSLTDLIVFNWMCAGLIAHLINKLSVILIKKNIPLLLFILAFPLQFVLTDTLSRLYRDNFLLLFLTMGTIGILVKAHKYSITSIIPVGLLRIANLSFFASLVAYKRINFKKITTFFAAFVVFVVLLINYAAPLGKLAIVYGTQVTEIEGKSSFKQIDAEKAYNIRMSNRAGDGNSLKSEAYSELTIKTILIRAAFPYLYPMSFQSPSSIMDHTHEGKHKGFYLFYMIEWLTIIARIFILPLLFIGLIKSKSNKMNVLVGSYFTFVLLVLMFSGQSRHMAGAFIFNAIFVANGHYLLCKHKVWHLYYIIAIIGLSLLTLLYNVQ